MYLYIHIHIYIHIVGGSRTSLEAAFGRVLLVDLLQVRHPVYIYIQYTIYVYMCIQI